MTARAPNLWVILKSDTPGVANRPVGVSIKDCDNVDDFTKACKKELSPALDAFAVHQITLHITEDGPALKPDAPLPAANSMEDALFVTAPPPTDPSSGPLMKAGRQKTLKKMSVDASCRKFLDAIATKLSTYYRFPWAHYRGPTIGDVLHAGDRLADENVEYGGVPRWSFQLEQMTYLRMGPDGFMSTVRRGDAVTSVPLPDVFSPDEWAELKKFNSTTTQRVHDGLLPTLSDGRPYIVLPHADYSPKMVEFLQTIGFKAQVLSDPTRLVVKDEDTLSEGSSLI